MKKMKTLSKNFPGDVPIHRSYWVEKEKLLAGAYPGSPDAEKAAVKLSRLFNCGIRHIINLMEPDETDHKGKSFKPYDDLFIEIAGKYNIPVKCTRYPIVDLSVPDAETMAAILDEIDHAAANHRPVYVHCRGGIGRTGTVVGCYLIRHRLANTDNVLDRIQRLRQYDPTSHIVSPETRQQINMVKKWE